MYNECHQKAEKYSYILCFTIIYMTACLLGLNKSSYKAILYFGKRKEKNSVKGLDWEKK